MSRMSSMPIESRIMSSVTPDSICCTTLSCWCVVVEGWITSDFASPTLASSEKSFKLSMKVFAAAAPPLMPKVRIEPWPCGRYFCARA